MATKPPASCHPDKPSYKTGLCVTCYTTKVGLTGKPGQILCGMRTKTGKPCIRWRDLDKQCRLHPRTLDDLEEIARKHCELTDQELPSTFGDAAEQKEIKRQECWLQFQDCLNAAEAARRIGVPNPKQFGSQARKHYRAEIKELFDSKHIGESEAISMLADHALGIQEYAIAIPARIEERTRKDGSVYDFEIPSELGIDFERLIADGKAHLIKGLGRSMSGQQTITLTDSQSALREILAVLNLNNKQRVEHTGKDGGPIDVASLTTEQRTEAMLAIIARGQAKLDNEA